MTLDEAVADVATALNDPGCLPFLGAGFSAWENRSPQRDFGELCSQLGADAAVRSASAVENAFAACNAHCTSRGETCSLTGLPERSGAAPSWFFRLCLLACFGESERAWLAHAPMSTIAQQLRDRHPRTLYGILARLFGQPNPNSRHRLFTYFPFDVVATTNYDGAVERARDEWAKPLNCIRNDDELMRAGARLPVLLKVHGSWDGCIAQNPPPQHAKDCIGQVVLCDEQYWSFPLNPVRRALMMDYLRVMVACRKTIFLGYSLSDFNIVEQLHFLAALKDKMHSPIFLSRTASPGDIAQWEARGIDVVVGKIDDFLSRLWDDYFGAQDAPRPAQLPPGAPGGSESLAVEILWRMAQSDPPFSQALGQATLLRRFPESLFTCCPGWQQKPERFDTFRTMGWLAKVSQFPDDRSVALYEFTSGIRSAVQDRIRGGRR